MQTGLNQLQRHILTMLSFAKSTQALDELKMKLAHYYAQKVEAEMEQLLGAKYSYTEKIELFTELHKRIPYTK